MLTPEEKAAGWVEGSEKSLVAVATTVVTVGGELLATNLASGTVQNVLQWAVAVAGVILAKLAVYQVPNSKKQVGK